MFQFPFGTMHQLNLDWFLQKFNELLEEWSTAEAGIDNALQAEIDRVEDAMTDLYQARDDAIDAKDTAVAAAASASGSAADALVAEGFALGEQNGTPVSSGSPYYQANAKYYSTTAGTYRYLSEAYARGTMGGTPVDPGDAGYDDNAKYYKDAADLDASTASSAAASADADALLTEGYAVGEQNGTPVSSGSPYYENNAKYFYQQTAQDKSDTDTLKDAANAAALRAEGWADGEQNGTPVGSGSPYYENNAKYYSDLVGNSVADIARNTQILDHMFGYGKWTGNLAFNSLSITDSYANAKATEMEVFFIIPAGTYNGPNINIETSAYATGGTVKYEVAPLPRVEPCSFKDEGVFIHILVKLIGNSIFVDMFIQSLTNRNNHMSIESFSMFNADVETIRAVKLWHYAPNNNDAATVYWKSNNGEYQTIANS